MGNKNDFAERGYLQYIIQVEHMPSKDLCRGEVMVPENIQKYENYRAQFKRLNRAMKEQFYLEAIFIVYAILEDRTESILRYEGNDIKPKGDRKPGIAQKLSKIRTIARGKKSLPNKYFSDELIDRIITWKNNRDRMIHALLKQQLSTEELARIAEEGKIVARELCNKANNYRRAVERRTSQNGN